MSVLTPTSLDEALAALDDAPTAMVLAGGTDVMVEVNESRLDVADDRTVLSVRRLPELRGWVHDPSAGTLRLGAAVTYAELERSPLSSLVPALAQAARTVGSPQIRNAATIGGNLATCSPAGDGLPVLAALDAVVEVRSATGRRDVPVADFMVGVKRTALQPGELITAVTVPVLDGWQGYAKVGIRNAMVIAIASACLAVDRPNRSVRLGLGSVAPTVVRAGAAESFVAGAADWTAGSISAADADRAGALAAEATRPIDDHRATAAYRRRAVEILTRRLLQRALPGPSAGGAA